MSEETSTSWHSYPKVYSLGHAALAELLLDDVIVEEKVDGSQFSFGVFGPGRELRCRSKGQQIVVDAPDRMFAEAVAAVKLLAPMLMDGWTYRGEYLRTPKHNVQQHARVPNNHVIIFDIQYGHEAYLGYEQKRAEAARIGLETVPLLFRGRLTDQEPLLKLLDGFSVLGGTRVEGIVVKNYGRFGADGKALMGKFVSEAFKEVHAKEWKDANPKANDILERLAHNFVTEARWRKAIQHLAEAGKLEDSPKDIAALMKEVVADCRLECEPAIRDFVFAWAWPHLQRALTRGLPEWYKRELLARQFAAKESA